MRLKLIIIGIVVTVIGLFFTSNREIFAQQWCGGCSVTEVCWTDTDAEGFPVKICANIDGCDGCTITSCGSGFYECSRGCCAVGTGTPGKGENEGGCEMETYQEYVCRETKEVCWQTCFFNKRGEEKCFKECEGGGEECSSVNRQRCKVDAPPPCVPSCGAPLCGQADGCGGTCASWDQSNWGAWGACSAVCGGGTQTRTNACGNSQGQVCNTQSCQGPWWQVKDGDITTNGDIVSRMPAGYYLDTIGSGGFPGVPVYGGQIGVTPGTISSTLWNANTTTVQSRIFNFSYFENLIPDTIVFNDINKLPNGSGVTVDANGYEWYKITGNLDTVGNIDFGSRKVILFIEGNLNIGGNINLTDGVGFFVSFVSGNISIAGTATSLEGIYESDGNITTGVGTSQLLVRGSVASYGSITMQRDLTDDTVTPAELFEFAPDQIVLFPKQLQFKRAKWAEVAP